jgi:5-(aminomethyl)-3-furanmethanol phosphate kinase
MTPLVVAKVGGSLFDLPDLRQRLSNWVSSLGDRRVLLVPGGGPAADVLRKLDDTHRLGEESAHWLALRVLTVNAHFLAGLLGVAVVPTVHRPDQQVSVLDAHEFCRAEEGSPGALEHSWRVTSDSVAAHAAARSGCELILLKSTDLPLGTTWAAAARDGLVDEAFPEAISHTGIRVSWVNLRGSLVQQRR